MACHFDAIARARDDALFDVSHDFYTTASLLLKGFDRLSSVTYDQTRSRLALHLDSLRSFLLEEFIEHLPRVLNFLSGSFNL